MRFSRPLAATTALAALAAGAAVAGSPATAAPVKASGSAPAAAQSAAVQPTVFRAVKNTSGKATSVQAPAAALKGPTTAKFTVKYTGFSAQAKASFQRAVNYWSKTMTSTVPITINATYTNLGPGVLGSAGPSSVWRDFPGTAVQKGTWYVDAIANKKYGKQLDASPDIVANFSSAFSNWYFGTGKAPVGKYDFQSVVTHEIGHGLGFLGAGRIVSGKGTVQLSGYPISYDRYTENTAGKKLLSYPDNSAALAGQITSNKLVFDSPKVRAANNNQTAKIYAPSSYQGGSSYSHLDEAKYKQGTKDSLMTPQLADGETIRTAGPITMAVFKTVGW